MNDLENRLVDYGLHLMKQATGVDPGPYGDVQWAGVFEQRMGGLPGARPLPEPCQTVFTRLPPPAGEAPMSFWLPATLPPGGGVLLAEPQAGDVIGARRALGESFRAALSDLDRSEAYAFTRFYHLMQVHASTLAPAYGEPGSTLFQQWKAVAALAWVAGGTNEVPAEVLLVAGDIPGIQRAIYTVSSKGAAKTLRGRSFFVRLLGDAAVRRLLDALNLCEANVIYDAGGNFMLLARGNQAAAVQEASVGINRRLLEAFHGDLHLALVTRSIPTPVLFEPFEFLETRRALGAALAELKVRPFDGFVDDWDALWAPRGTGGEEYCSVTGVDLPEGAGVPLGPGGEPGEGGVIVSPLVKSLFDLAYSIRHADLEMRLTPESASLNQKVSLRDGWDAVLAKLSGWRYAFPEMPLAGRPRNPGGALVYALNHPEAVARGYHGFRFIANVTPHVKADDLAWWAGEGFEEAPPERGDIRGFAMLANAAAQAGAIERVGVLRMDVDSLGELFTGDRSELTMPLLGELSAALERFFGGRLNEIVRKAADNDAYIIYAGGDDLFIVGAWHVLPDVAEAISKALNQYTGGHPGLTISGGITLEQPKFPIYRAATRAHMAQEAAKDYVRYLRYDDGRLKLDKQGERQPAGRKDALCFLGTVVGWEEWPLVRGQMQALIDLVKPLPTGEKAVPKAILHVVQKLHRDYVNDLTRSRRAYRLAVRRNMVAKMAEPAEAEKESKRLLPPDERQFYGRWRWMQAYALSRMARQNEERRDDVEGVQRSLLMPETVRLAGLAARWAEYRIRKED